MARRRLVKRGLLAAQKPHVVTQHLSVDEFGELPARKREARRRAEGLGHDLGAWHRRRNDPYRRWNAFYQTCNLIAVVCVEAPDYLAEPVYGHALTRSCAPRRRS